MIKRSILPGLLCTGLLQIIFPVITGENQAIIAQERARARDLGVIPGVLAPGTENAITDVEGVKVGHVTLLKGDSVRTGVTVILPHPGNLFREKVNAAVSVGNGFGKALGFTQVKELGNLETPIGLTNTMSVFRVADGLVTHTVNSPENLNVRSVNPVVGETNDGWLNDIRGRHVTEKDVLHALKTASSGPVAEGNVGAGTGTRCLGFKGGIGTSSRVAPGRHGGYTVGVLVQTNFGGFLTINGAPVGEALKKTRATDPTADDSGIPKSDQIPGSEDVDGSCMIVIATDAPLSSRNLERLAKRSFLALGKVGSYMSNGSGDYAIAFSTHGSCRIVDDPQQPVSQVSRLGNDLLSPLFLAVVEATEEAIYNSLFMAEDMTGHGGRQMPALPIRQVLEILDHHHARK